MTAYHSLAAIKSDSPNADIISRATDGTIEPVGSARRDLANLFAASPDLRDAATIAAKWIEAHRDLDGAQSVLLSLRRAITASE